MSTEPQLPKSIYP
jgi:hypothetical protein